MRYGPCTDAATSTATSLPAPWTCCAPLPSPHRGRCASLRLPRRGWPPTSAIRSYDCFYLALAIHEQHPVVTADTRFREKIRDHPYLSDRVVHVAAVGKA